MKKTKLYFSSALKFGFASLFVFSCSSSKSPLNSSPTLTSIKAGQEITSSDKTKIDIDSARELANSTVAIEIQYKENGKINNGICTGIILSKKNNLILTANHCAPHLQGELVQYRVLFGKQISKIDSNHIAKVVSYLPSPMYNRSEDFRENFDPIDIAVLKVDHIPSPFHEPLFLNKSIKDYPNMSIDMDEKSGARYVLALGYGQTKDLAEGEAGSYSDILKIIKVGLDKGATERSGKFAVFYTTSQDPVTLKFGAIGPCHGDSGGPVFVQINSKYYLAGLMSQVLNGPDADPRDYFGNCRSSVLIQQLYPYESFLNNYDKMPTRLLNLPQ